jgi:hypothetical protein
MKAANVLGAIPYAVGWLGGVIVRFVRWVRDAFVVGYHDGIGDIPWREQSR